ncbi:MAG: hypothetical protein GOMPHAMPRED_000162 [Gomphillus americanus]|uniref:Uncharacterized protein n=1 Tax=Gomphillus americanus TaxID=1940652 RepID=A0A8H3ED60_9LECA|nr:MAG: hypothetical protein GOMPHAMPRED_000162 [Gomphillus americanus]
MSEDLDEAAVTNAISSFSIANQQQHGLSEQQPSGVQLSRHIVSRSSSSKDITSSFQQAAGWLQTGELVKDELFTLFDAVAALEIMDAKMDSGYLEPGEPLEDYYDVLQPLLPEELIGIMDSLLCLQVAWQIGYPLSQTVFASVFVENILWPEPRTLKEATFRSRGTVAPNLSLCQQILRVYCLLLIKSCDFIYRRISEETYYEEEDFFTQLYNRPLLTVFPSEQISLLAVKLLETLDTDTSIPQVQREAIISRLKVQYCFLDAVQDTLESILEAGKPLWEKLLDQLQPVQDSHKLGKSIPGTISSKLQRRIASSVPPRPVVELSFPSAIEFMKRLCKNGSLLGEITKCDDLSALVMFVSFFQAQHPQPTTYMRCQLQRLILHKFSYLEEPSLSVTGRHKIYEEVTRLVYPDTQLAIAAEADSIGPVDELTRDKQELTAAMHRFAVIVHKPLWIYVRTLTMNRSRTRRMLCHTAIEWDVVQLELEDLDADIRQYTSERPLQEQVEELWEYPLSSWAYDIKLRQLISIHQLSVELEIIHKEELSTTYWTLQWICSVRHGHLQRIALFVKARANKLNRPTRVELEAIQTTLLTLQYHTDHTIAIAALAEGLAVVSTIPRKRNPTKPLPKLYHTLTVLNLLSQPRRAPYSSDSLRHLLRTRPFQHILQPSLPASNQEKALKASFYEDLVKTARQIPHNPPRQNLPAHLKEGLALLDHVDSMIKTARKAWDQVARTDVSIARAEACETAWRADIKNIQKSTIAAGLVSSTVRKWIENGAGEGELDVQVEMGHDAGLYHVFWIVPKVKRKA